MSEPPPLLERSPEGCHVQHSPLHPILIEKFRRAFGAPHRSEGKDQQRSLRSLGYIASINVLINGSAQYPVVWVFDPHDPADGVTHERVIAETEIDPLIKRIEDRVRNAARTPPSPPPSPR